MPAFFPGNPVAAKQVARYLIGQAELPTRFPLMGRIPKPGAPRELIFTRHPCNLTYPKNCIWWNCGCEFIRTHNGEAHS